MTERNGLDRWAARQGRAGAYLLVAAMGCALVAACGDDGDGGNDDGDVFQPYASAPQVRLVHLAPSAGPVLASLERPSTEEVGPPVDGEPQVGPPVPRSITAAALALTAYTPELFYAARPTAHLQLTDGDGNVIVEEGLALDAAQPYLVALVESAGELGVSALPLVAAQDQAADGQARVGVFHAAEDLGRVDVALQGADAQAQWASLSFGTSTLREPKTLPAGSYTLHLLEPGGAPVNAVAPTHLELSANTVVQLILAPGAGPDEWPRVVFIVDPVASGAVAYPVHAEPTD